MRRPCRGSSQRHWANAAQDTQPHPNDLGQFRVLQNPGATYGYFAQGVLAIRHLHPTAFLSFVLIAYNFLPTRLNWRIKHFWQLQRCSHFHTNLHDY